MTLTSAPELETLESLTHDWRHVATWEGPGEWTWHGDLSVPEIHRAYKVMRDTHCTLTQASHRPSDGRTRVFASLSQIGAPEASYAAAVAYLGGAIVRRMQADAMRAAASQRRRRMLVA